MISFNVLLGHHHHQDSPSPERTACPEKPGRFEEDQTACPVPGHAAAQATSSPDAREQQVRDGPTGKVDSSSPAVACVGAAAVPTSAGDTMSVGNDASLGASSSALEAGSTATTEPSAGTDLPKTTKPSATDLLEVEVGVLLFCHQLKLRLICLFASCT